jgi:hypothetical protein
MKLLKKYIWRKLQHFIEVAETINELIIEKNIFQASEKQIAKMQLTNSNNKYAKPFY